MDKIKKIEISKFLAEQASFRFHKEIAIIAVYGSVALGTDDIYSDIDMYAIVDNENDTDLPWNFIFQGQTIEFWKMDWQIAEQMALGNVEANPWTVSASLFVDNKILYARSKSDRARFNSIYNKIKRSDEINIKKIVKTFNSGYSAIERLWFAKKNNDMISARWAVWNLINFTTICLSLLNNIYFKKNWGKNLQEAFKLPLLSKNYSNQVKTLSTSSDFDEMISIGRDLLSNIRNLVLEKQKQVTVLIKNRTNTLWNNYIGIKSYINKIRAACQKKDILTASYAATELQIVITEEIAISEKKVAFDAYNFNLFKELESFYNGLELPDLTMSISERDFQQINKKIDIIDFKLEQYYKSQGVKFNDFKDWDELKSYFKR